MTPEELNRKMEFIVEHQAKFSAGLGDLTAYFKQLSERQEQDREDRIKFEKLVERHYHAGRQIARVSIRVPRLER